MEKGRGCLHTKQTKSEPFEPCCRKCEAWTMIPETTTESVTENTLSSRGRISMCGKQEAHRGAEPRLAPQPLGTDHRVLPPHTHDALSTKQKAINTVSVCPFQECV